MMIKDVSTSPLQIMKMSTAVIRPLSCIKRMNDANHYPVDRVVCLVNIYPLDSDLSGR